MLTANHKSLRSVAQLPSVLGYARVESSVSRKGAADQQVVVVRITGSGDERIAGKGGSVEKPSADFHWLVGVCLKALEANQPSLVDFIVCNSHVNIT